MKLSQLRARQSRLSLRAWRRMAAERAFEQLHQWRMQQYLYDKQKELWEQQAAHNKRVFEQRGAALDREAAKLPELIPTWADKAVADKERMEIAEWAVSSGGMTRDELYGVCSASAVAILRKAWLHDLQALDQ